MENMTEPKIKSPLEFAVATLKQTAEFQRESRSKSIGASTNFHEKLAVLTAGSLALAVSGAGALYQKPLTDPIANRLLFDSLAISVACLWVSLVSSVIHNFLESYALHLDSKTDVHESTINLIGTLANMDENKNIEGKIAPIKKRLEDGLMSEQLRYQNRAIRARNVEMPLSVTAISLFALGYLSVVGYVFVLARSIH